MSEIVNAAEELLSALSAHGFPDGSDIDTTAMRLRKLVDEHYENVPGGHPIVCIDFDGVLHSYTSGWRGVGTIPDPPVDGAIGWLVELIQHPRIVPVIYSSRSKETAGIVAMHDWLMTHLTDYLRDNDIAKITASPTVAARAMLADLKFPTQKPAASLTIDDRAHCFTGKFPSADEIMAFKPWHKR